MHTLMPCTCVCSLVVCVCVLGGGS
jgi:hypothetical protein